MRRTALFALILLAGCATQDAARRLETTPRHDEWVQITRNGRVVHAFVSYPQVAGKAPAVVVIHENRGLTDWVRRVADQLAEQGYIAIAPDLLSGMAPKGGRTVDFPSEDAAREAISKLPPAQVMADLQGAADYVTHLPAASGTLYVAGFCWGGARTWELANQRRDLAGAFVFYGTGPQEPEGLAGITAPVFGFYGGDDARVNATIVRTQDLMRAAGKRFEPLIYDGAGHAFMRLGEEPNASPANRRARDQAWVRWLTILRGA
jgi:carboxymethylenebutenolidase